MSAAQRFSSGASLLLQHNFLASEFADKNEKKLVFYVNMFCATVDENKLNVPPTPSSSPPLPPPQIEYFVSNFPVDFMQNLQTEFSEWRERD